MHFTQEILKSRNVCGKTNNVICMVNTKKGEMYMFKAINKVQDMAVVPADFCWFCDAPNDNCAKCDMFFDQCTGTDD